MSTHIDILAVRRKLGRNWWGVPRPHGSDGWSLLHSNGIQSIVITCASRDGIEWIHASMTGINDTPSYAKMCELHRAVWGDRGYSYEIHPPRSQHVNIHPYALHLWGRADGRPVLPEFGTLGTI